MQNGTPTGELPVISISMPDPDTITIADSVTFTREYDGQFPGIGWELARSWSLRAGVAEALR